MMTRFFKTRAVGCVTVVVILMAVGACAPSTRSQTERALRGTPDEYRDDLLAALDTAGENRAEILYALRHAGKLQKEAVAFLVANMPARDLEALKGDFILTNVKLAYAAREKAPWGADIPNELFLNYVLPYASVNERRDDWREDFFERFLPRVHDFGTPAEAALWLNKGVFKTVNVQYHPTKRPKPDQSPYESIEAGYASCTGLSILMIDACRAVCIPARFVGTPSLGAEHPGNHSWVEIWDGQWYFLGVTESDSLNSAWFVDDAAHANAEEPLECIYATSFKKTPLRFPLVWDLDIDYVSARNVTKYYTDRKTVEIKVLDRPNGNPVAAVVTLCLDGELYARGVTGAASKDGHDVLRLEIPGEETYEVEIVPSGAEAVRRAFRTSNEDNQKVTVFLSAP